MKGKNMEPQSKPKLRGFAALTPERRAEISKMGGASVPKHKRKFSTDKDFARKQGVLGGQSVKKENRSFSKNRALAVSAGAVGGRKTRQRKVPNEQVVGSIMVRRDEAGE